MQRCVRMIQVVVLGLLFMAGCYASQVPLNGQHEMFPCTWPEEADGVRKNMQALKRPPLLQYFYDTGTTYTQELAFSPGVQSAKNLYEQANAAFDNFCSVTIVTRVRVDSTRKAHLNDVCGRVKSLKITEEDPIKRALQEVEHAQVVVLPGMKYAIKSLYPAGHGFKDKYREMVECYLVGYKALLQDALNEKKNAIHSNDTTTTTTTTLSVENLQAQLTQKNELIEKLQAQLKLQDSQKDLAGALKMNSQIPEPKTGNSLRETIVATGVGAVFGSILTILIYCIFLKK